jgi:S1-C subfamily serine protease
MPSARSRRSGCRLGTGLLVSLLVMLSPGGAARLSGQATKAPTQESRENSSLEELAAKITPAVVLIDVKTAAGSRQGSGFIVDPSGRILTNHHVIRDAQSARVKLSSGDVYDRVEILADDPRRDIAVLQVPGYDLPSVALGNSDSLHIGSPVVLISSPLGLENTVSTGIVSGRRQEQEGYQLIQVSAPASSGSSGGPLLSASGQAMGIAVSQMEAGQNLNFVVPINYARGLLAHLAAKPLTVLQPTASQSGEGAPAPSAVVNAVNQGLFYDVDHFEGYQTDTRTALGSDRMRHVRVTYRLIETVGGAEPQVERYLESETAQRTEPFGTVQTVKRERSRMVVRAHDLQPVSAKGRTQWWTGKRWNTAGYDLRFKDDHVVGLVSDTTGHTVELDRDLPRGIILRGMGNLAFALLSADSLVGRSVELTAFDPDSGDIVDERYDVRGDTTILALGRRFPALRVNVAEGLDNETLFVRSRVPRVFLRRVSADGAEVEDLTDMTLFGAGSGGDEKGGAGGGP